MSSFVDDGNTIFNMDGACRLEDLLVEELNLLVVDLLGVLELGDIDG